MILSSLASLGRLLSFARRPQATGARWSVEPGAVVSVRSVVSGGVAARGALLLTILAGPLVAPAAAQTAPEPASAEAPAAAPAPQLPSAECRRYRAELASVQAGGSATRALQDEIGRLQTYFRSLNCEGTASCSSIRGRRNAGRWSSVSVP